MRADHWIQNAGARDIIKAVPESYLLGDRAVYVDAFLAAKGALSPDGMFPEAGAETARRALASIDPEIANAKIDLAAIWTNDYVKRANAKAPQGLNGAAINVIAVFMPGAGVIGNMAFMLMAAISPLSRDRAARAGAKAPASR